ncbi:TetR family transcriptional regulator [Aeromicrobium sp. SMF47]|uniref:TetR family transcriptional regulator n=1 Tax=Aeromicrobium yanjiei TaxID=2662028 RepID=A0A5Q2MGL9_9ACTN|nr:TetR/AcrR family transcriptional regulator [Aeromicrobium yanjiei]MRJ76539.1 TetR family transcriptional regulator [Aeromicrobium yanjiei]QGG42297.1 TetR family transcriptional regulator [Aeromicrobium yanjiei]
MERRVRDATCRVYGRTGWSGFSIEAVAREAGVGKASIYLRWTDRKNLLVDSLVTTLATVADVDTGSLREDLRLIVTHHLRYYFGDLKEAAFRMATEASLTPELRETWDTWRESQALAARATVRRGIERGDVPADVSVTLVLDTLLGGALMHALVTPQAMDGADIEELAASMVDFVLAAAHA